MNKIRLKDADVDVRRRIAGRAKLPAELVDGEWWVVE